MTFLLDALNLLSRIVTSRNLKEAFENQRGLPLESFYYGEEGYDKLLKRDTAEIHFEVDVEQQQRVSHVQGPVVAPVVVVPEASANEVSR